MLSGFQRRCVALVGCLAVVFGTVVVVTNLNGDRLAPHIPAGQSSGPIDVDDLQSMLPDGYAVVDVREAQFGGAPPRGRLAYRVSLQGPDQRNSLIFEVHGRREGAAVFFRELPAGERNVASRTTDFFDLPNKSYDSFCVDALPRVIQCYGLVDKAVLRSEAFPGSASPRRQSRRHVIQLLDAAAAFWKSKGSDSSGSGES